jgi:hypothetical protein
MFLLLLSGSTYTQGYHPRGAWTSEGSRVPSDVPLFDSANACNDCSGFAARETITGTWILVTRPARCVTKRKARGKHSFNTALTLSSTIIVRPSGVNFHLHAVRAQALLTT